MKKRTAWNKGNLKIKCLVCGKEFKTNKYKLEHGRKYCSRKCFVGKGTEKVICKGCGKEFIAPIWRKYQYCSKKCCGLDRSGKKGTFWKGGKTKLICKYCKKEFYDYTSNNTKYCSTKCGNKSKLGKTGWNKGMKGYTNGGSFKDKENHRFWQGGTSFEPYGLEFNKKLREQIRKRDNYTCQECNFTQEQLGYKLHVHHIDYNKKNNDSSNLISLCNSCHAKTGFNREDWIKYFQMKAGEKL